MSGRIHIRDLALRTIIGVSEAERTRPQDVAISLELETDLAGPAASDDIDDAVDYGELARMLVGYVEESRFHLIESLAASVAELVLEHYPAVASVVVTVNKPGALAYARSVGATVVRRR